MRIELDKEISNTLKAFKNSASEELHFDFEDDSRRMIISKNGRVLFMKVKRKISGYPYFDTGRYFLIERNGNYSFIVKFYINFHILFGIVASLLLCLLYFIVYIDGVLDALEPDPKRVV